MIFSDVSQRLSPAASPRLVILAAAVLKAGETARASLKRRRINEMLTKAPRDYQTEIDVSVERIIVEEMVKAFPSYAIQGRRPSAIARPGLTRQSSTSTRSTARRILPGASSFWHDDLDRRVRKAGGGRRL